MWVETSTLRYIGGSLALSDILLHTTLPQPVNLVIHRGQSRFSLNPRRSFAPSETLHLYVEVYNLSVSNRRCEYEVTYSIHGADTASTRAQRIGRAFKRLLGIGAPPSAIISQSFERGGTTDATSEEIAIDIRALPPGDYVLVVSAVDRISGEEARASKSFVKLRSGFNGRGS